jgi:energy-coupling factor transporter ATP-binding protein EcfA2
VRALTEHGVVLLLGNPSSGKSAIGAILATLASDAPNQTVLALTSPHEFEASWESRRPQPFLLDR